MHENAIRGPTRASADALHPCDVGATDVKRWWWWWWWNVLFKIGGSMKMLRCPKLGVNENGEVVLTRPCPQWLRRCLAGCPATNWFLTEAWAPTDEIDQMHLSGENLRMDRLVLHQLYPDATQSVYHLCRELLQRCTHELRVVANTTATDFHLIKTKTKNQAAV